MKMDNIALQTLKDEKFIMKLMQSENIDEVKNNFQNSGIFLKDDELQKINNFILDERSKQGAISDDMLGGVSGGNSVKQQLAVLMVTILSLLKFAKR